MRYYKMTDLKKKNQETRKQGFFVIICSVCLLWFFVVKHI